MVDVLDAKYEFLSVVFSNMPIGTNFTQSGQTLTWNNVSLNQTCNTFGVDYGCLNPVAPSYCVIIKVKVKAFTPPGNIDNAATLSDNGTNTLTTEKAKVNIKESSVLKFTKEVSTDLLSFSSIVTFRPQCDDGVFYKISVTNLGNKDVLQYQVIDELPDVNDVYFPTTLNRGSDFSFVNVINRSAPDFNVSFLNNTPSSTTSQANFNCNTVSTGNSSSSN
ncbi:hypothetical protein [Aestuariibaculum sediminum]|uniref:DUF11 domain-containing protein n=1 Tax=Aestuariibaculum sediminum TaxID=2770637 RepID=A0A8J6Q9E8_9FLAO|nr:hypothetical protein [Aestuariibaculum sediminum]MBD0832422.1 hypothetical protein [Aestuariibaculum sediminum]